MTLPLLLLAACADDKPPTEETSVVREDLGGFTTDAAGGVDVPFEVPDAAVSAVVYCGPYGYDRLTTAESITGPDGSLIYDRAAPVGMRVDDFADVLAVHLPQSPERDIVAGAHVLRVLSYADDPVALDCAALYRVQPVADAVLDLKFVFVGVDGIAPGLNANEAPVAMAGVVTELTGRFAAMGIALGDIQYRDFDGELATYTSIEGSEELGGLLRTVDGERSLTFYFVQAITDDAGASPVGAWDAPPGIPVTAGTSRSGVAVRADGFAAAGGVDQLALRMAHQAGHFLGLSHTSEEAGDAFDPLFDTPECVDADGNGRADTAECAGKGAENLMWWGADSDSREVSPDQAWVVQRSAAVR